MGLNRVYEQPVIDSLFKNEWIVFNMMFDSPPDQTARLFQNAQQRMMNNWAALLQSEHAHTTDAQTLQSLLAIWRETVQRGIRALTQHVDPRRAGYRRENFCQSVEHAALRRYFGAGLVEII